MKWQTLDSEQKVDDLILDSEDRPQLVFKHSTTCSISSIAKNRLEDLSDVPVTAHYLDLLSYRSVSNYIAEHLEVHHESPQIILIHKKEVILDSSHLDITTQEIKEVLQYHLLYG